MPTSAFRADVQTSTEHVVSEDDFSVKVECGRDRLFWLRALKDQHNSLIVTDFKRSDQSDQFAANALSIAIARLGLAGNFTHAQFLDIVPGSDSESTAKAESARLAKILVETVTQHGWRVDNPSLIRRNGKFDFVCDVDCEMTAGATDT